jgi:hypothetical protein
MHTVIFSSSPLTPCRVVLDVRPLIHNFDPSLVLLVLLLSEADFYKCKGVPSGYESSCDITWNLREAVSTFVGLHDQGKYITTDSCLPYRPGVKPQCSAPCTSNTLPAMTNGRFSAQLFSSIWNMQEHIRLHGSIICNIDIYDDFRPFFKSARAGVYKGPGKKPDPMAAMMVKEWSKNSQPVVKVSRCLIQLLTYAGALQPLAKIVFVDHGHDHRMHQVQPHLA